MGLMALFCLLVLFALVLLELDFCSTNIFDISTRPHSTLYNDIWTTALYSASTLQILSTLLPFICFLLQKKMLLLIAQA